MGAKVDNAPARELREIELLIRSRVPIILVESHEELRAGAFPWLQVLVHPEIWVYPGSTMGATMDAMLDAQRSHRLELLAGDRIDLS